MSSQKVTQLPAVTTVEGSDYVYLAEYNGVGYDSKKILATDLVTSVLSNDVPIVDSGSGLAGVSTSAARSDHVHPLAPTVIADNSVTMAKLADVASGTVFYRKTAGTGDPEVQTLATLKADLSNIVASYTVTGSEMSNEYTVTLPSDTYTKYKSVLFVYTGSHFDTVARDIVIRPVFIDGSNTELLTLIYTSTTSGSTFLLSSESVYGTFNMSLDFPTSDPGYFYFNRNIINGFTSTGALGGNTTAKLGHFNVNGSSANTESTYIYAYGAITLPITLKSVSIIPNSTTLVVGSTIYIIGVY